MADVKPATQKDITTLIKRALQEDIQSGDVTTDSVIEESRQARGIWKVKESGVLAGLSIAKSVFKELDPDIQWNSIHSDGQLVEQGTVVAEMSGSCRAILTAERTALNIAQRLSGIATKTYRYAEALKGFDTEILDTRKTAPGLRKLDKYAVKVGGGTNHRMGLYDLAMIKDNHIVAAGSIAEAVKSVRSHHPDLKIEVEATDLQQVKEALAAGADIIMLDNMEVPRMKKAVELIGERAETEASGNITYEALRKVAATGVNFISAGALTHSVNAFDISQQIQEIL